MGPYAARAAVVALAVGAPIAAGGTWRVSVDSAGVEGNTSSNAPVLSGDGRYVAFHSAASNLVTGDTNNQYDVFVHDRLTGVTERVSVDSAGLQANQNSFAPALSADGRWIAFESDATNLVPGDGNGARDVFLRDRTTGTTTRVSVDSAGAEGDAGSSFAQVSDDGLVVAFHSSATNLVAGDLNGLQDVFARDLAAGTTTRVSVDSTGVEGNELSRRPALSGDGLVVAFESEATNLATGDTNNVYDVFVHELATGSTTRVSVSSGGAQGTSHSQWAAVSDDGQLVAFHSFAGNLVTGDGNGTYDVFVRDRLTATTTRVSVDSSGVEGNGVSQFPALSGDGNTLAFESHATNLVAGDGNAVSDVFVRDLGASTTRRASTDAAGTEADRPSQAVDCSGDGRFVAFDSQATNLVPGDTNGAPDAFVQGPFFTLEADPLIAPPGATLTFTTYSGLPGGLTVLTVIDLNGTPLFLNVVFGVFDPDGTWVVAGPVPPGLMGLVATFLSYGIAPDGKADLSNTVAVTFT